MSNKNDFHIVTLRLTNEEYKFVKDSADYYGISVNLMIRIFIESAKKLLHRDIENDR